MDGLISLEIIGTGVAIIGLGYAAVRNIKTDIKTEMNTRFSSFEKRMEENDKKWEKLDERWEKLDQRWIDLFKDVWKVKLDKEHT